MKFNGMSPLQNVIMQSRSSFENLGSSSSHSLIFISTINMMYVFLTSAIFWSIRQPGEARPDYLRCRHFGGMNDCRKREKVEAFSKGYETIIRKGFYENTLPSSGSEILRHVLCTAGSGRKRVCSQNIASEEKNL